MAIYNLDFSEREVRQEFYRSSHWRKLRSIILKKSPLCKYCLNKGIITPASVCDHIIDIKYAPDKRLDSSNITTLCEKCHNEKSSREAVNSELDMHLLNRKWNIKIEEIPKKKKLEKKKLEK